MIKKALALCIFAISNNYTMTHQTKIFISKQHATLAAALEVIEKQELLSYTRAGTVQDKEQQLALAIKKEHIERLKNHIHALKY